MGIDFQPLGPDTRNQYNKLPEEIKKQNGTIDEALNTKVAKRRNVDTGEERGVGEWDPRALPTESLLDRIAEGLFGRGEGSGAYVNRKIDGFTAPGGNTEGRAVNENR